MFLFFPLKRIFSGTRLPLKSGCFRNLCNNSKSTSLQGFCKSLIFVNSEFLTQLPIGHSKNTYFLPLWIHGPIYEKIQNALLLIKNFPFINFVKFQNCINVQLWPKCRFIQSIKSIERETQRILVNNLFSSENISIWEILVVCTISFYTALPFRGLQYPLYE